MEAFTTYCASPVGILRISGTEDGVTDVMFLDGWEEHRACLRERAACPAVLSECREQLQEYFRGKRWNFHTLRIAPCGTAFQQSVWREILAVPWGAHVTYQELGRRIDYPMAAKAVGGAVARNPLAIVIPCHRVLPREGGGIGGYAFGGWRKQWLLRHESVAAIHPFSGPRAGCCTQEKSVLS